MLTYLACPYSHPDPAVRVYRFEQANRAAAQLMEEGHFVFSPISHTHPIALAGDLPLGWDYWQDYDRAILAACRNVVVLTLIGWERSVGIQGELRIAAELGLTVTYREPQ